MRLGVDNANYAAQVIEVRSVLPQAKLDNLVAVPWAGYQALVQKTTEVGQKMVAFPPECQLSEEFCAANNLYRHNQNNSDQSKTGYLEDNRRVRAIRLRTVRSDCLLLSSACLSYLGIDSSELVVGMEFQTVNGNEICRKYVVPAKNAGKQKQHTQEVSFKRVDARYFPLHPDTAQFFRNVERLDPEDEVIISQKLHGTSLRVANTLVRRKLRLRDKIARKLGVSVQDTEYDMVYGSRKVTKDANNPNQAHFYSEDLWSRVGHQLDGILPRGWALYGEIIGWTENGSPIQKNYTYDLEQGQCALYVYRVAQINPDGLVADLSWDQTYEFCRNNGLNMVPELWRGKLKDFHPEQYLDIKYNASGYHQCVPLCRESPCDEGVVVRIDGLRPEAFKVKGPAFLAHETAQNDAGQEDIEA